MIQDSTTLVIQPEDFTSDGNLRKEAYDALKTAAIVIDGTDVIKNSLTGLISQKEPAKRKRNQGASSTAPNTGTPPRNQGAPEAPTPSTEASTRTPRNQAEPQSQAQGPDEAPSAE